MIAWDGSREAARAASDAIPLLAVAEQVLILVVDAHEVSGGVGGQPGSRARGPPARHEVKAEVRQVASGGAGIAEVLLAQARDEAADLLVMGGYGHSRLREMMLGGTTRHILEHTTSAHPFSPIEHRSSSIWRGMNAIAMTIAGARACVLAQTVPGRAGARCRAAGRQAAPAAGRVLPQPPCRLQHALTARGSV